MRELFTTKALTIPSGHAVSGIAKKAHTVRVRSGRIWVTVEGISHDYWLSAGDTFTLTPGLLTVIEADGTAGKVELARAPDIPVWPWRAQLRHLAQLVQRFGRTRNAGATVACRSNASSC